MGLQFSWDSRKDSSNRKKHGIGFDEAVTVFFDPLAKIFDDPDHSMIERREIIIGHSANKRVLLVVFTERQSDMIRVISARRATVAERHDYEESI